jgi:hypothetical protein
VYYFLAGVKPNTSGKVLNADRFCGKPYSGC